MHRAKALHLHAQVLQRSKGRTATRKAAYNSGSCIKDKQTGTVHDYRQRAGVLFSCILAPAGVEPPQNREKLWNAAEAAEKRKDGTPAREYEIALPVELAGFERQNLALQLAEMIANRHGCAVDLNLHAPSPRGDQRNFHAHFLCTTRKINADGRLGEKCDIELSDRERKKRGLGGRKIELLRLRKDAADLINRFLESSGHKTRVIHESYEAQGIDRIPTVHLGATASQLERLGMVTELGEINREIEKINHELAQSEQAEEASSPVPTPTQAPTATTTDDKEEEKRKKEEEERDRKQKQRQDDADREADNQRLMEFLQSRNRQVPKF